MKKIDLACIIDDDPVHIFVTTDELEKTKMFDTITSYKNGKEAFEALKAIHESKAQLPDLILLDLNMPIWDGWDFLDEFTQLDIEEKIVILIITSSNNPEDILKAKNYDEVQNFVVKPVTADLIMDELKNYQD